MAIVWESITDTDHYQVRSAGGSIRLYKNNVFHSQWNENRPLSGGVWDLLFIPSLFLPDDAVKRVLLLGVGGGAVIRQYLTFQQIDKLVGVELDCTHLKIARQHFGVQQQNVELIAADAISWVESYIDSGYMESGNEPGFDIVIEDLFTEREGEPVRVAEATADWFRSLRKLLRPGGALIINFEDPAQLRACGDAYVEALEGHADFRYGFTLPSYGNCVGVFLPTQVSRKALRARLDELLSGYPACRRSAQKFRIRQAGVK